MRPGGGNKLHECWQETALFRAGVEYPLAVAHNIFNHKEQYFGSAEDVIRYLQNIQPNKNCEGQVHFLSPLYMSLLLNELYIIFFLLQIFLTSYYGFTQLRFFSLYFLHKLKNILSFELLSNDNAFLSTSPRVFTQRTLLARFPDSRPGSSDGGNSSFSNSFFIKKPIYNFFSLQSHINGRLVLRAE